MKDLNQNVQKPFKFLKFWIAHEKFKDIVKKNWDTEFSGNSFYKFNQKLKLIKKVITKWSKDNFGDIFQQLIIREEVVRLKEQLFEEEPSAENKSILQKAHADLKQYLHIKEEFWRQKAEITWFSDGDRNTSFFHNLVKGRRNKL